MAPKKMEDLGAAEDLAISRTGKLLSLAFQRIILDEAHTVRYITKARLKRSCGSGRVWAGSGP